MKTKILFTVMLSIIFSTSVFAQNFDETKAKAEKDNTASFLVLSASY